MRMIIFALLLAISYAQTASPTVNPTFNPTVEPTLNPTKTSARFRNFTTTQPSLVNSDIYVGCQQVEYQSTCEHADQLEIALSLYDYGQCSQPLCTGAGWTEKNNNIMRTLGAINCQVIVSHHGSDSYCEAGAIITTTVPGGFPTPTPTMGRNFELGSDEEGIDAWWIIACLLIVMFCCQLLFFGWCCYTDALNKRAKRDTYNMPIEMGEAPKNPAPVLVTGPAEDNGVDPVNITLEKVPSTSVGGMDIVKSISPSVSTYQVADGTLPGSFYNEQTAPTAPEANLGDSLRAQPSTPTSGGAVVTTPKKNGMADEIRKLKALADEGIISEEEFQSGKAKLLGTRRYSQSRSRETAGANSQNSEI